jgi:hypothetical protein
MKSGPGDNNGHNGELVLYKYNNGKVLVTNRRIVLGRDSWAIEEIEDVSLVTVQDNSRTRQTLLGSGIQDRIVSPIIVSILGLLLALFPPFVHFEAATFVIGGLVFLSGLSVAAYIQANTYVDVYKIELVVRAGGGGFTTHTYTFDYKPPAQKTVLALRKSLAAHGSMIQ